MKLESFVPEIVRRHDRVKPWADWIPGTVLFADISGFTPMSEALAVLGAEGAEILTGILNRYFAEMIGILNDHRGHVMKFGGDSLLCFLEGVDSLEEARRVSLRMQKCMQRFRRVRTPVRNFTLQMKIGIAAGECLLAGLGDPAWRCEYAFAGEPVDRAAGAEQRAAAGEIVVDERPFPAPDHDPPDPGITPDFNVRSYMIPEVYDLVNTGYEQHAGSLAGAVSAFLQFTGFQFSREGLDLERLNQFTVKVLELTRNLGGRVNRLSMGDKGSTLLALFGTPAALEKKETFACQWAVDIRKMLSESFPELELRIGMTSGRVFSGIVGGAGRFEFTAMGDTVNLAARLMQGAEAGQVCADSSVQEKTWETFEFKSLDKRRIKGKSSAVEVFALRNRRPIARMIRNTAVYGRTEDVASILRGLEPARSGSPCMLVLEGEPGIGKSSLAEQVVTLAAQDWNVVTGKGDIARRGFAYNPWRDPIVSLVFGGTVPGAGDLSARLQQHGFADYFAWHSEYLDLEDRGASLPDPGKYDEESRRNLLHHQLSVMILRAIQAPVLLFLDDLHWFKSTDLDLLTAILNHVKDQPLAILATARPDWPRESFVDRSTCNFRTVAALNRDAIREMAEKMLDAPVRDNVVDFLEKQAGGNPFFLRQLLDHLMRNQLVTLRLGEWTMSREGVLDRSLSGEEIVVTKVDQLSPAERMHLRAAACIGPTLSRGVLQKGLGSSYRVRVLQSLQAYGHLNDAGEQRLAFPHALLQEAVYHSLPMRLRRRYHRRIGYAIEERHSAEIAKYLPALAHHFFEGGVRGKALEYCIAAGNEFHARRSFPEALHYLNRARSLLRAGDAGIWDVELKCADNLLRLGRLPECLQICRKTRARAKRRKHPALYRAWAVEFDARYQSGDYSYVPMAQRLLQDPALASAIAPHRILYYIAVAEYRQGKYDAASSRLAEIIRHPDPDPTVLASYMYYASLSRLRSNFDEAMLLLEQAFQLARDSGSLYRALSIRTEKGNVLMDSGKAHDACLLFKELLGEVEALGDFSLLAFVLLNLGTANASLGQKHEANVCFSEAKVLFSRSGLVFGYGKCLLEAGALLFDSQEYNAAYEHYLESVAVFETANQLSQACLAYFNVAEVLAKLGRKEEAIQWLAKGKRSFKKTDDPGLADLYANLEKELHPNTQ